MGVDAADMQLIYERVPADSFAVFVCTHECMMRHAFFGLYLLMHLPKAAILCFIGVEICPAMLYLVGGLLRLPATKKREETRTNLDVADA